MIWVPMRFFLGPHCGGGAAPSPLHPPTRFYFVTGAPWYPFLLFPVASTMWVPMCFFLRTSFLVRIAAGGAAPSPLHPPTRFYFVTGTPCYLLLFLLLFPSTSMIWVPMRFFLGTHCRGEGAAPPPCTPPPAFSL